MSQQINLFNPAFEQKKKHFSAVTMAQASGLVLIGALGFYGYAAYQVSILKAQAAEADNRFKAEQNRLTKLAGEYSPQQKSKLLTEEIERLKPQVAARREVADSMKSGAMGNTQGYSEYMKAFARQSVSGLWLTGFRISGAGDEIGIAGRVLRPELVPAYIRRLNQEPVMRGREFSFLKIGLPKQEESAKAKADAVPPFIDFELATTEPVKAEEK